MAEWRAELKTLNAGGIVTEKTEILTSVIATHATTAPQLKAAGREVEIKFLLSKAAFKAAQTWARLQHPAAPPRASRLSSIYFDTQRNDLHRHGAVLRVRAVNRRRLLTFKWNGGFAGGAFERGEVEVATRAETPDAALLGPEIAGFIETICEGRPLELLYKTEVKRVIYQANSNGSEIEVAFDTGLIIAGAQSEPICEVEMELKAGDAADVYQLGMALAEAYPLTLGCQSKSERGQLLRAGSLPAILHAPRAKAAAPNVDEAISLSLSNCISHFIGNWPAYAKGDRSKAVHQMRVAMRRLRSVIGAFQRAFPCAAFTEFRQQAKDIATVMGNARNWDVFIDLVRQGPLAAFPADQGFAPLLADSERQRDAEYHAVTALLAAPQMTRFILSMQSFIARHEWRNGPSGEVLPSLTAPAEDFFALKLTRLHQKISRDGKHLNRLTPQRRHELRKRLKKLRYLVELFNDLFDRCEANRKYRRAVANLQDQLGKFNDLAVAEEMAARLNAGQDLAAVRAVGIIIGWCGHGAGSDNEALYQAWKTFKKMKVPV